MDWKTHTLFYSVMYKRLFNLLNIIIDDTNFNINSIKLTLHDFLDSYSYYLTKKSEIQQGTEERTPEQLMSELEQFSEFTETLNKYPTQEFIKIKQEMNKLNTNSFGLGSEKFYYLYQEYYSFFTDVIDIIKKFIDISNTSGFLPNTKNKALERSIGFTNYEFFFNELENLKLKASEITTKVSIGNIFKSRRCIYTLTCAFSPYFSNKQVYNTLIEKLSFDFVTDKQIMSDIRKAGSYKSYIDISTDLLNTINESILSNQITDISVIKRYISYEFGELDLIPRIKPKYAYDPTNV